MKKIYVVMEAGIEYDDETHYVQGWENLGDTAFLTVEEARANAKLRLVNILKGFAMNDFSREWDIEPPNIQNYLDLQGAKAWEATWGDYIRYCEMNEINWVADAPELVIIREIQVPE